MMTGVSSSEIEIHEDKRSIFARWRRMAEEDMKALEVDKKYMFRNGAMLLEKQIALNQGKGTKSESLRIFSAKEIRQATKNFDRDLMVGRVISTATEELSMAARSLSRLLEAFLHVKES